ncbi:hypothetical protein [Virgisporangium aurantiacum]|uniref:Uncharacterized protein n=1 Tax=Virgisporangium aurantiacum TaxID=175570 RepID=A0A8J4E5Q2_9ACTN|nr:hypothetical protein [Virgisporangium aurantiacum]GIJ62561.1 hypothetical protein Vau01_100770 [Virgisporangium aurantiacum]
MRSVDDIRRVLLDHESFAPDGTGLVEAARAGAVRVRRRRRLTVAAAVVVALVVPVAVVAALRGTGTAQSAVTPASPPYRSTLQVSVGVDPNSGYSVLKYWVNRDRQQFTLRPRVGIRDATVLVHNPATFDSAPVRRGQPVTVAGHAARYVPDLDLGTTACWASTPGGVNTDPARKGREGTCSVRNETGGPVRMPAIGWVEPSGAWVVVFVSETAGWFELLAAASAVRVSPPRGLRLPYHLGHLPAGLSGVYVAAIDSGPWMPDSTLALDPDPAIPVAGEDNATGWIPAVDTALTIRAIVRQPYVDEKAAQLVGPTKIAGLDTYFTDRNVGEWRLRFGSSVLVVVSGGCQYHFTVRDKDLIPYAELARMVENATFADCADPATWTTPLT